MDPRFQPERGVRKPNLVIAARRETIILHIQIRPDSVCSLDACNKEKIAMYNQSYFLDAVREVTVMTCPSRSIPSLIIGEVVGGAGFCPHSISAAVTAVDVVL